MKIKLPSKEEQYQWLIVIGIFCPIAVETSILVLLVIWTLSITRSLKLNKFLITIIIGIFFTSIIGIFIEDYKYSKFVQQFVLCTFYIIGYYNIIQSKYFETNSIFNKIIKISIVLSWIGILQFLFSLFTSSESHYIRPTSLMAEPGYLARCLFPSLAFIVLSKNWKSNKVNTLIIIMCFLLTQSAVGCIVFMIFITYYLYFYEKFRYLLKMTVGLCIVMSFIIFPNIIDTHNNTDNQILKKATDTFFHLKDLDPSIFETLNLSSYAFLTNLSVSINSPLRIFGTGLGTHSQNYFKTISYSNFQYYGLNSDDAFSLAIRLYSEFGILMLLFVYLLLRKLDINDPISASLFFTIFFILLRGGHYTQYGTIFIVMLFFMIKGKKLREVLVQ